MSTMKTDIAPEPPQDPAERYVVAMFAAVALTGTREHAAAQLVDGSAAGRVLEA